jgi:glycosyltransferase involved in cell wall biosynthesis
MKCNIVLHPYCRGWILEKIALRLNDGLLALGIDSSVSDKFDPDADINHFAVFHYVEGSRASKNTMFITHVDDALKLRMIKDSLNIVDLGICMSRMTLKSLVAQGIPNDALCFISPAHDGGIRPRRIRVGITSNLPPDGRKRESLLVRLAMETDLSDLHFEVFGKGWSKVAEQLRAGGATVAVHEGTADYAADYAEVCRSVPDFDYYLYTGLDEGALGTLDALAAGIPTITTPQGFHADIPGGVTYPFWNYDELRETIELIVSRRRRRIRAVANLTWTQYAGRHLQVWQALLDGRKQELPQILGQEESKNVSQLGTYPSDTLIQRAQSYAKLSNRYRWRMLKTYYSPRLRRKFTDTLRRIRPNGNG